MEIDGHAITHQQAKNRNPIRISIFGDIGL